MPTPTPGQKTIPIKDWNRFLRVADWFEATVEHGKGVLRPTYGQALIVKTPEGGIDARDGETIFSATCIKCVAAETATAGEKTIHETDEELLVYNLDPMKVPGDYYVKTNLTANGTRYAESVAYAHHRATLTAQLNEGSTATATLAGAGDTITVTDVFLASGEALASGAVVGVEYNPWFDEWTATEAKC